MVASWCSSGTWVVAGALFLQMGCSAGHSEPKAVAGSLSSHPWCFADAECAEGSLCFAGTCTPDSTQVNVTPRQLTLPSQRMNDQAGPGGLAMVQWRIGLRGQNRAESHTPLGILPGLEETTQVHISEQLAGEAQPTLKTTLGAIRDRGGLMYQVKVGNVGMEWRTVPWSNVRRGYRKAPFESIGYGLQPPRPGENVPFVSDITLDRAGPSIHCSENETRVVYTPTNGVLGWIEPCLNRTLTDVKNAHLHPTHLHWQTRAGRLLVVFKAHVLRTSVDEVIVHVETHHTLSAGAETLNPEQRAWDLENNRTWSVHVPNQESYRDIQEPLTSLLVILGRTLWHVGAVQADNKLLLIDNLSMFLTAIRETYELPEQASPTSLAVNAAAQVLGESPR